MLTTQTCFNISYKKSWKSISIALGSAKKDASVIVIITFIALN